MKIFILSLLAIMTLSSCAKDDSNVTVTTLSSPRPLIPGNATSCLASKSSDTPSRDIEPDYFTLPSLTFTRKDVSKNFRVTFLRISIPLGTENYECVFGGDELAALHSTWWSSTTKDAVIPAGSAANFTTDCAIRCGGIARQSAGFSASGVLEVMGAEFTNTVDETPVRTSTVISIQGF